MTPFILATADPTGATLVFDIVVWLAILLACAGAVARALRRRRHRVRRDHQPDATQARPPDHGQRHIDPSRMPDIAGTNLPSASADGLHNDQPVLSATRAVAPEPSMPRYPPAVLGSLAQYVDNSRRLAVTEGRVAAVLATLPRERWLVERYVQRSSHRIPFLVLGRTGVFTIWTIAGPPPWHEPPALARLAARVRDLMPDYPGPVHVGLCRALAADIRPRVFNLADPPASSVWIMGLDWLIPWLEQFDPQHGFTTADLDRFDTMAGPHWGRATHPHTPPGIPAFDNR